MKRLVLLFLFGLTHMCEAAIPLQVSAQSAIVINAKTGKVLYSKNATKKLYPASLTKIASCIVALEQGQTLFHTKLKASETALRCVGPLERQKNNFAKYPPYTLESDMSHIGLKVGEEIDFEDLLYGMMVASGDDAANVVAERVGGTIEQFMNEVQRLCMRLHCTNTNFVNPSGLHHPDHYTTAVDIALLSQYAMKDPQFRSLVATRQYEKKETNKQPAVVFSQTNKLLKKGLCYCPYAIGIKTGYHRRAQHNVAAAAQKDDRELICVLMHCEDRNQMFREAKYIFEKIFKEEKEEKVIAFAGVQSFTKELAMADTPLSTFTKDKLAVQYYPSEAPELKCILDWDTLSLPVEAGKKVGSVKLYGDQQLLASVPLYARNNVHFSSIAFVRSLVTTKLVWMIILGAGVVIVYIAMRKKR